LILYHLFLISLLYSSGASANEYLIDFSSLFA
jgi:hypothetical protein